MEFISYWNLFLTDRYLVYRTVPYIIPGSYRVQSIWSERGAPLCQRVAIDSL